MVNQYPSIYQSACLMLRKNNQGRISALKKFFFLEEKKGLQVSESAKVLNLTLPRYQGSFLS